MLRPLLQLVLPLVLVGGKKGLATLYALTFTFLCVICMYIPLLYVGGNGILAAILTSMTILLPPSISSTVGPSSLFVPSSAPPWASS